MTLLMEKATSSIILGFLALALGCSSTPEQNSPGGQAGMGTAVGAAGSGGSVAGSGAGTAGTTGAGTAGTQAGGGTAGATPMAGATTGGAGSPAAGTSGSSAGGAGAGAGGGGAAGAMMGGTAGDAAGGTPAGGMAGGGASGGGAAGASGDSAGGAPAGGGGAGGMDGGGGMGGQTGAFVLTAPWDSADGCSPDNRDPCELIPDQYTMLASNPNEMPELSWTPGPDGTQSYALVFHDHAFQQQGMPFVHWALWNIPPDVTSVSADSIPAGAQQASFQGNSWAGPGGSCNVYELILYALSTPMLDASDQTDVRNTLRDADDTVVLASDSVFGRTGDPGCM